MFTPWPNVEYASVSFEAGYETLFLVLPDINPSVNEVCKVFIKRVDQSRFELIVLFFVDNQSDRIF